MPQNSLWRSCYETYRLCFAYNNCYSLKTPVLGRNFGYQMIFLPGNFAILVEKCYTVCEIDFDIPVYAKGRL